MATDKNVNKAVAKPAPATETYVVISPLNYDGEDYAPGAEVELSAAHAEPLLGHTVRPKQAAAAADPQ